MDTVNQLTEMLYAAIKKAKELEDENKNYRQQIVELNGHIASLLYDQGTESHARRICLAESKELKPSKITAIKQMRAVTGFGLKDAKDAIERYWGR